MRPYATGVRLYRVVVGAIDGRAAGASPSVTLTIA
jgi:hypothetical protein